LLCSRCRCGRAEPSSSLRPLGFSEAYRTLWGSQHQTVSPDGKSLTLWMDSSSGSGFKSARAYRNGYFGASVRVQPGYTAGVNTAFYVSDSDGWWYCYCYLYKKCMQQMLC
jgi:xyloglucan:xyloglucosyl transferase